MSCNIFGHTNTDIVQILEPTIQNPKNSLGIELDFDLFITPNFIREGCTYGDLKTKKLVIANWDICTSLKDEFFPAINDFVNNGDVEVFVLTPHYLLNERDKPELFKYDTIDFFLNQFKSDRSTGHLKFSAFEDVYKSHQTFLKPKKFLVYLGSYRVYRYRLFKYLSEKYSNELWLSFNSVGNWTGSDSAEKVYLDFLDGTTTPQLTNLGLFLTSYFSIIFDTIFDETYNCNDYSNVKFTDKVYRAIRMYHPFIYMGQPGALKKFRELGFKTFPQLYDESYDDIVSPMKRYRTVLEQIDYIMTKDSVELLNMANSVEKTLRHNFTHIDRCIRSQEKSLNEKLVEFLIDV